RTSGEKRVFLVILFTSFSGSLVSRISGAVQYSKLLTRLNNSDLLLLDDWGLEPLSSEQRSDLLEIVDLMYQRGSIIVVSQLPVENWYKMIGDSTHADAILDRLVHGSIKIELKGESMRKIQSPLTEGDQ
ncbi:ATP-binding protein, partial [Escherichia coli]|uniref:ATP-binding protein n=1 Tax=Escherichia coli TaxID=562 RepID=UPI001CF872F3